MIIKVKQLKAELANEFVIYYNDESKYMCETEFRLMCNVIKVRDFSKRDIISCTTAYDFNPIKLGRDNKYNVTDITDRRDNIVGCFYEKIIGLYRKNIFFIKYNGEYTINAYNVAREDTNNVTFYLNGIQIGEMVKASYVRNCKDQYYLYLLDEYSFLADILSLFIIHYDIKYYNSQLKISYSSGEYGSKNSIQVTHVSNDDDNYNPNWIEENFDDVDIKRICAQVKSNNKNIGSSFNAMYILIGIIVFFVSIIVLCENQ